MLMYKWFILFLFIYGCKSSAKSLARNFNGLEIVYQLPKSVTELLAKKIKGQEDSVYFELDRDSMSFSVSILSINKKSPDYRWIMCSNHKLEIGKSIFPVLTPYDRDFGAKETPREILFLGNSDKYVSYSMILMTGEPFYVKVDSKGKVIYAGN